MQFVVYQCGFRCFMLFCLKRIAVAVFYALILMLNLVLDLDLVTLEYYLKNVYFNKNSMNIIWYPTEVTVTQESTLFLI